MKSVGLVPEFHVLIFVQIHRYLFCIQRDTYELVEHLESVNTTDIAILFNYISSSKPLMEVILVGMNS
jgi:hypothetical protein